MLSAIQHALFDVLMPNHSIQRGIYMGLLTIVMVRWNDVREPMAVLSSKYPCRYPSLSKAMTDYAEGKLPPHYPVPCNQYLQANADWQCTGIGWVQAYRKANG